MLWFGLALILLCIYWPFGRRAARYNSDPKNWPCTIRCVRKKKVGGRWVKAGEFIVSAKNSESAVAMAAAQYEALRALDKGAK